MRDDPIYQLAEQAAIDARHIERCEQHDHVLLIVGDDESERRAYAFATNRAKDKDYDMGEAQKAVAQVITDAVIDCPYAPCNPDAE
jgi:hypothetical protein